MPRSITPLLAERLDISEERAQSLLRSMLTELHHRAEDEGVQLAELGTFRNEEGTLTFVPSSSLRRRVNHQFEGLSAEDLSAPDDDEAPPTLRETPDPEEAHDTTLHPASAEESTTEEASPTPEASEPESGESGPKPPGDDQSPPSMDPIEEDPEPSVPSAETPPSEPQPQPSASGPEQGDEESIPTLDPIETEDEPEEVDASAGHSEDASSDVPADENGEAETEEPEESQRRTFGSLLPILGSILMVVVVAGVLWYVIGGSSIWSSSTEQSSYGSEQTTATQTPDASSSPSSASSEGQGDTADPQTDRFAGVAPGDQEAADEGATASGQWTIVVASLASRSTAEEVANDFAGRFAPVEVVRGTVNGQTRYRVTLGRYASEAAAERALDNHASDLPPDAWTHDLQ